MAVVIAWDGRWTYNGLFAFSGPIDDLRVFQSISNANSSLIPGYILVYIQCCSLLYSVAACRLPMGRFSSLGQALFLLGASVPLTSSSLFLPPSLSFPSGPYIHAYFSLHSFFSFSVFPLFAHIFIIHPFAHINLLPCF